MDGVEVTGVFNANMFWSTFAMLVSKHYKMDASLKNLPPPPVRDERAARPAKSWDKSEKRVST